MSVMKNNYSILLGAFFKDVPYFFVVDDSADQP